MINFRDLRVVLFIVVIWSLFVGILFIEIKQAVFPAISYKILCLALPSLCTVVHRILFYLFFIFLGNKKVNFLKRNSFWFQIKRKCNTVQKLLS